MAKVTVRAPDAADEPAQPVALKSAPKPNEVRETTDSRGRMLRFKVPNALGKIRLFEYVGKDLAANDQYLGYAMLAYCVTHIDGVVCSPVLNKLTLEARVAELDDDGLNAVAAALTPESRSPEA